MSAENGCDITQDSQGAIISLLLSTIYMAELVTCYKDIPIEQLERDPYQPRRDTTAQGDVCDNTRLLNSVKEIGIEQALVVVQEDEQRYKIIDGHRRHKAAKELGLKVVPCKIHAKLSKGELEKRRFQIQNNRREWKPMERAEALHTIKRENGYKSNREVAESVGISATLVHFSLKLRDQTIGSIGLMEEYKLPDAYRVEFVRLKPKIRKIKNIEAEDIPAILFEKVKHGVIKNAKAFRKLHKIFLRAHLNENDIHEFLTNPDTTVDELDAKTVQSGPSLLVEKLLQELGKIFQEGSVVPEQDTATYTQLRDFLVQKFPLSKV